MWGHLSSLGQNVAQITKAVGAQLLEAAADEQRLDAADFSDGDTAECSAAEPASVLTKKVQRLQDKLARARDEIDRLNDIRARAVESVSKSLKDKDEEIDELRQLLEETRTIASESLSPPIPSSPDAPSATSEAAASDSTHVATPVIHQKIKASERVSLLTRKLHEEKRTHIAALHQIKSDSAKLKDRLHSLENQIADRDGTVAELEAKLATQTETISLLQSQIVAQSEDLESHKLVITRLRSDQAKSSDRENELESLRETVTEQAETIARLQSSGNADREHELAELRSELERSKQAAPDLQADRDRLQSLLESERAALSSAFNELDDLRHQCDEFRANTGNLHDQVVQLSADLERARSTIEDLQAAAPSSEPPMVADSDLVPRQELNQLREKARAQLRQLAQKCKALESENAELKEKQQLQSENSAENLAELFVKDLRSALPVGKPDLALDALKEMIVDRFQSDSTSTIPPSSESELLTELRAALELDEGSPAVVISEVRASMDRARTAMAQTAAMTQAYEQALESVDRLTASKTDMKTEIEKLTRLISELQTKCRAAYSEEAKLQEENAELRKQNETLQHRISDFSKQQGDKQKSAVSQINTLQNEVQYLQKEMGNKDAVIRELNAQLEQRTKNLVETESQQDIWLEQAQRDREVMAAESSRLRQDLETISAEYEARIVTLQDQIRKERDLAYQSHLDLQASKDLAADYAAVQMQLRAKAYECANLSDALDNLQVVLEQFQAESESKLAEAEVRLQASLDAAEEGRLAVQQLIQITRLLKESEATVVQLEAKLSSSRKYVLQIESDNAALRHAVQQTMDRIKTFSSDENLVDRRIVNKLLVTYFERKASVEVLNLMIRMLGFTDDQKRLVLESQRPKGLIFSLSSLIPTPYSAEEDEPENEPESTPEQQNLADLWVNFLLKETGSGSRRNSISSPQNIPPNAPSPVKSRSASSQEPLKNGVNSSPASLPEEDAY